MLSSTRLQISIVCFPIRADQSDLAKLENLLQFVVTVVVVEVVEAVFHSARCLLEVLRAEPLCLVCFAVESD